MNDKRKDDKQEAARIQQEADEKRQSETEGGESQVVFNVGGQLVDANGEPVKKGKK
jgi:hypothetical protein